MGQIIAVDFDGVINSYKSGWIKDRPDYLPDPPVYGAIAFLAEVRQQFDVVIHSTRLRWPKAEAAMRTYIEDAEIHHGWSADVSYEFANDQLSYSYEKPPAHVLVDDRCIQFTGKFPSMEDLISFKPWNKRSELMDRIPTVGSIWGMNGHRVQVQMLLNMENPDVETVVVFSIASLGRTTMDGAVGIRDWSKLATPDPALSIKPLQQYFDGPHYFGDDTKGSE